MILSSLNRGGGGGGGGGSGTKFTEDIVTRDEVVFHGVL